VCVVGSSACGSHRWFLLRPGSPRGPMLVLQIPSFSRGTTVDPEFFGCSQFFHFPLHFVSRRRSQRSIWVWLFDFVVAAGTSLQMSRSWKECHHLAPDVSILERVPVTGPGCIREGCMSCVVMSTYVSMSIYVSYAGMSRRTYGSCENCVYKEGCLPCFVFFFSSCNLLYSIRNINLASVSSVSSDSFVSSTLV